MSTILFLELVGFYVQNCLKTESGESPSIAVHHNGIVIDACKGALKMGVKLGTSLSEAKAILRENGKFVALRVDDYISARNEWLDLLLSAVSGVEADLPHRAFVDLSEHPNAESVASQLIRQVQKLGYSVRAGLARAKWISELSSHSIPDELIPSGIDVIEHIRDSCTFLDAFPTRMLLPIPIEHRERLEFLGYRWIRDVARAPLSLLIEQFGKQAYAIHACASGLTFDKVEPNYPQNSIVRLRQFGAPVNDSLLLNQAIEQLCAELSACLCTRDEMAQEIRVTFSSESEDYCTHFRRFARPVFRAASLRAAATALAQIDRIPFAPTALRILLSNNISSKSYQQVLIGHQSLELRKFSCDGAINSLQAAYGSEIVSPAVNLKSPRRIVVLREWKRATGWSYGSGIRGS